MPACCSSSYSFLEFVAPALGQVVGENGHYQLAEETPALILDNDTLADDFSDEDDEGEDESDSDDQLEDDDIELEEDAADTPAENAAAPAPAERPRFAAPHKRDDGTWPISYEYTGKNYSWVGPADNIRDAMTRTWLAYHS